MMEDAVSRRLVAWARRAREQAEASSDALASPSWLADDLAALLDTVGTLDPDALAEAEAVLVPSRGPASPGLHRLLVALGRASVRSTRHGGDDAALGRALHNLGVALTELGEHDEALLATEEAVEIRTLLVEVDEEQRFHLARSWHSLAIRRAAVEDHDGATAAADRAVGELEVIAERDPARSPDLARALHNLATKLSRQERHEEAVAAAARSVELRRSQLIDADGAQGSDGVRFDLAVSLINLAGVEQRQGADGHETTTQEAIDLLADLVRTVPEARRYLSAALHNLAESRLARGDAQSAEQAARRAVQIRRVAVARAAADLAPLGRSLLLAAQCAAALGRDDATSLAAEAIDAFLDAGRLLERDRSALNKARALHTALSEAAADPSGAPTVLENRS